jgi:glycosyltransferase involved in cell wall biosynthesis
MLPPTDVDLRGQMAEGTQAQSADSYIRTPRVSVGLPVYNGDRYLEAAIDSILNQTFTDLELIISDNASDDRTQEICESYVQRDPRVRYFRQSTNLGAGPNYNFTFHEARGEFFKWAAHDDVLEPTMLERCVEILDRLPDVALAFTRILKIDEHGDVVGRYDDYDSMRIDSSQPHTRFADMACGRHNCVALFGLMRRSVMQSTMLHPSYEDGDRHFLAQMSLRGRILQVPEDLFKRRDHPGAYTSRFRRAERVQWWDVEKAGRVTFPSWNALRVYSNVIRTASLSAKEKLLCYSQTGRYLLGPRWYRQRWVLLIREGVSGLFRIGKRALTS